MECNKDKLQEIVPNVTKEFKQVEVCDDWPSILGNRRSVKYRTLPESNIVPENKSLEDDFPFGMAFF